MTSGFSLYDILGVPESATAEQIKDAYRASVLKYHPDVNKAPNAQRLTEMLNSAYEVLSDPAKRQQYDAQIRSGTATASEPGEPDHEMWDMLTCDGCGTIHPHLRFANFFRVWSIVFYTRMIGIGGVLCPDCRSRRATTSALFSAILGPWGLPWGIIYTLRALIAAARGGEFPRLENAQLLRHQALAFLQRNYLSESLTNFQNSLKFEKNDQVSSIVKESTYSQVPVLPNTGWLRGQTIGLASFFIPVVLIFALSAWAGAGGSSSANSTTASETSSASTSNTAAPAETAPPFQKKCLHATKTDDPKMVHAACVQTRTYLADRSVNASEQSDKDDYAVLGAMAEYAEAVSAQKLGLEHEAEKEGNEAIAVFATMKDSAADPDAKKAALRDYNCYKLNACGK